MCSRAGLSLPSLAILASIKDLGERGILEFNFELVFFTYGEFAKAKLVGSGKVRFAKATMKDVRLFLSFLPSFLSSFPSFPSLSFCFSIHSTD
jgi:hypothetical protein